MKTLITAGASLIFASIAFAAPVNPEGSEEYQNCLSQIAVYDQMTQVASKAAHTACRNDSACREIVNEKGVIRYKPGSPTHKHMALKEEYRLKAMEQGEVCMAILDALEER